MAWKPTDNEQVGQSEHIGRRLFDEPKLSGAPDQNPWAGLQIGHFLENRDAEFSVDRLGKTGIDKTVIGYLKIRCAVAEAATRKPRRFDGWAFLTARKIIEAVGSEPVASPIRSRDLAGVDQEWDDEDPKQNRYHAHVAIPNGMDPLVFAVKLRDRVVTEKGIFPAPWLAIDSELRREMIAKAAYYRAERRGFEWGHEAEDWLAAENEVDEVLRRKTHVGLPNPR